MQSINRRILSTVSFAVLAIAGVSAPAHAQSGPQDATAADAAGQDCATLPEGPQRDECVRRDSVENPIGQSGDVAQVGASQPAAADGDIVVTGSRIRRDETSSSDPLQIINPELALQEGEVETAEVLQQSPLAAGSAQVTSVLSTNFVFDGGPGVQTLSLRGLGANRTLVLLNGRRAGPAGTRGGVGAFDLNVIPTSAIRTVEILKTGASSIYGSDAIAGVVNLITRTDLDGFELRGFLSAPVESGGETFSASLVWGSTFDRGHFLIGADYFRRNELEEGDRDFFECPNEFVFRPDAQGQPDFSQRADLVDPRTGRPSCQGLFAPNLGIVGAANAPNTRRNNIGRPGATRIATLQFNYPGERLDEFIAPLGRTGSQFDLIVPAGFFPVGGFSPQASALTATYPDGSRGVTIIPRTERYTLYANGAYELSPSVELFADFLFNKRITGSDGIRQLLINTFTADSIFPSIVCASAANPAGEACNPASRGDPLAVGFAGPVLLRTRIPVLNSSRQEVDYYRGVIGARGTIEGVLPELYYDSYLQYSRSDGDYQTETIFADSVETLDFRTETCAQRGQTVTRIRGVPCLDINLTDPRVIRGDFTQAERDYLFGVAVGNTVYEQITAELSFGGELFQLPAGPLAFALGAHFRRDEINDVPSEQTLAANDYGRSSAGITAGFQRSTEVFGELRIPLIHDTPLIQEFTIDAAARLTNSYAERASDGLFDRDSNNWTYKVGANWQVTDFLRLRGSYGTSYRAPALFEQFLQDQTAFIQPDTFDPCQNLDEALEAGTVSARVNANCRAQGIPGDFPASGRSATLLEGGGIGLLDPETSRAITASVILTPPALFGGLRFSLAVDYIDIRVKGQVTQLTSAQIVNGCYNSEFFPNEPLCDLFQRAPATDSLPFRITDVRSAFLNIDSQRNRALDFTARVSYDAGTLGRFAFLGVVTHQLEDEFTLFEGTTVDNNGEVGDPKWVGDFNLTWNRNNVTVTYGLDWIAGTSDEQDLLDAFGDYCVLSGVRGGLVCTPYELPTRFYHSISTTIALNSQFDLTAGVANLFDSEPPRVSTLTGAIGSIGQVPVLGTYYDYFGRRFFASVRARF